MGGHVHGHPRPFLILLAFGFLSFLLRTSAKDQFGKYLSGCIFPLA